jgi:hypothetical protein
VLATGGPAAIRRAGERTGSRRGNAHGHRRLQQGGWRIGLVRRVVAAALALLSAAGAARAAEPALSIEALLRDGWEVAGYVAVSDNRSLILFKHSVAKYLVQCSVLIDVMRHPRLVTYCYELK